MQLKQRKEEEGGRRRNRPTPKTELVLMLQTKTQKKENQDQIRKGKNYARLREKEGEGMREELNEWITIRAAFISSSRDLQWMTDWTTYRDWRPGNQDKTDKCRQNQLFHTGSSDCWLLQSAVECFKVVSHVLHIHFSLMVCLSQWSLNLILHALDPRVLFFAYFECLSLSHSSVLFRSRETNEHSCLLSLFSQEIECLLCPLFLS